MLSQLRKPWRPSHQDPYGLPIRSSLPTGCTAPGPIPSHQPIIPESGQWDFLPDQCGRLQRPSHPCAGPSAHIDQDFFLRNTSGLASRCWRKDGAPVRSSNSLAMSWLVRLSRQRVRSSAADRVSPFAVKPWQEFVPCRTAAATFSNTELTIGSGRLYRNGSVTRLGLREPSS